MWVGQITRLRRARERPTSSVSTLSSPRSSGVAVSDPVYPPLSPLKTGVRCRCPRCGVGPLFQGYLTIRKECTNCGLDYSFADPADGP
ncbi:MAG: DUF983 domain-containing protein, partial [Brevundimonas sp.]